MIEALIAGAFSLAGVVLPLMWRAHGKRLDAITDQVANNHQTNLRDDLDFIRDAILDVRTDVGWLRRDHMDLTARVSRIESKDAA